MKKVKIVKNRKKDGRKERIVHTTTFELTHASGYCKITKMCR